MSFQASPDDGHEHERALYRNTCGRCGMEMAADHDFTRTPLFREGGRLVDMAREMADAVRTGLEEGWPVDELVLHEKADALDDQAGLVEHLLTGGEGDPGCPVGDPDCLNRSDEEHDGCKRPAPRVLPLEGLDADALYRCPACGGEKRLAVRWGFEAQEVRVLCLGGCAVEAIAAAAGDGLFDPPAAAENLR